MGRFLKWNFGEGDEMEVEVGLVGGKASSG